ncbi:MAG: DUF2283 domain-containing protein [Candidatus Verstraetearchaeota archaeon]|nr:DUF2283 domain-containing protein [Candidatus Verstraetearchaeota archaeon]
MKEQERQSMKVELDLDKDVLYIKVKDEAVKGLIKMSEDLYLELSESGSIVGIQLRNARRHVVEGIAQRIKKLIEESGSPEKAKERADGVS